MLLVRPPVSIFQQIVLPYLSTAAAGATASTTSHRRASHTSTKTAVSRQTCNSRRAIHTSRPLSSPPDAAGETSFHRPNDWEPYEGYASGSRRGTREYLGLDRRSGSGDAPLGEDAEDTYTRTTALALERIIRSHSHASTENPMGKGKGKEVDRLSPEDGQTRKDSTSVGLYGKDSTVQLQISSTATRLPDRQEPYPPTTQKADARPPVQDQPFPPLIHQLLKARQFRLTTLHILNYPTYALDQILVHRVAGYMDRQGGQAAARRLRKGKIPSPRERDALSQDGHDTLSESTYSRHPNDIDNLPPSLPNSLSAQDRLTAFYNTQLARDLSATHLSKGFHPPKAFPLPSTSLRQLRALLSRIHTLEESKGFVPDRVTANLVLSCWVRSALAPPPDGVRVVLTKDKKWTTSPRHTGRNQDRFGAEEMRRLFNFVTGLFDRSARPVCQSSLLESSLPPIANRTGEVESVENVVISEGSSGDPDLSYSRHVKPFVRIFRHGFKRQRDRVGLDRLKEWDDRIKLALSKRRDEAV